MIDLVLVNCPPWGVVMPPLGIAYLTAYLKAKGIKLDIYDLNLELYQQANEEQRQIWNLDTINKVLPVDIAAGLVNNFENNIDLVIRKLSLYRNIGLSVNSLISTTFAGIMAKRIKNIYPDKKVILGGPGCYHSWDRKWVPKEAVDFFVIGEAEEALFNLILALKNGNGWRDLESEIPGVLNVNSQMRHFSPAEPVRSLDKLPYPSFEEFDLDKYNQGQNYRPLPMLTSRGCINRCSFCSDWYMCYPFRMRSPEHINSEIRHHVERYQITHVEFNDLLCNGNLIQLGKLCDLLIEDKLNINWISYAAIRKDMTTRLLEKMRQAGCSSLCYGLESASDFILKRMNKHYNENIATDLLARSYNSGIQTRINLIFGFPGETEDDFKMTLDFLYKNRKYISQVTNVSSFVLMPNSDLGIYPRRYGIQFLNPQDPGLWTDENGLTQEQRNLRVAKTCDFLKQLGIKNLIVNYQEEKIKDICWQRQTKNVKNMEQGNDKIGKLEIVYTAKKRAQNNHLHKKAILLFLIFIFSLVIDFYLMLLKKIRGSIIFPGS